ncbi:helix-turn-helix domain-containing protein [Roseobacter sp. S98]|uniref:helix-turn-helix domain-containing protein n=1 Tax=Roseobacter algicola (ex Choi et al. 2025) (nom. illeg.) TaxID=3092138 RepID=UPI0035C6D690
MTDLPPPPANLKSYVDILGTDMAVEFLLTFGGAEMYFPDRPGDNSELVRTVGVEKARAICAASGRIKGRIPIGKPWIARVLNAKGLSNAKIARRLHVSDVTVRKYLSGEQRSPNTSDQLSLF